MNEIITSLVVLAVSAVSFIAYRHPEIYEKVLFKMKWSTDSEHLVKGINYPNEVNNESRKTKPETIPKAV